MEIGSIGRGTLEVKYGRSFPETGEEKTVFNIDTGSFVVKYIWVGTPEWTPRHTVLVPTRFKIIEVLELSKKQKAKESGFKIIQQR